MLGAILWFVGSVIFFIGTAIHHWRLHSLRPETILWRGSLVKAEIYGGFAYFFLFVSLMVLFFTN